MARILNVLVPSDIHFAMHRVEAMKTWLAMEKVVVDVILCPGDTLSLDNGTASVEETTAALSDLNKVLAALRSICDRLIFLPGNHDPPQLFTPEYSSPWAGATCLHKRVTELAPGLVIAGLGGSVPAYRGTERVWTGYPYAETGDIAPDCQELVETVKAVSPPPASVILFTHCGPAQASTATATISQPPVQSGAPALGDALRDLWPAVFLAIHGHTHDAAGSSWIDRVQVVNPGSLSEGRFAVLKLQEKSNRWELSSARFEYLGQ
eukprot:TRINITY_DN94993_c0_g1_i1.p1 TRINITY_DN94993_c0_g1~~TRINITY_DN94993_c0_g1_i1.p1  ORF type:complete len:265 (+),score=38.12 TRINITY_DN94993_c0_g1_i1:28-822(+)